MTQSDKYPKQFLISLSDNASINNWAHEETCGVKLSRSKSLPLVKIVNKTQTTGFILGWFVYNNIFFYNDSVIYIESEITSKIYNNICGRFIIVEKIINDIYLTTDPGSQLAAVYDTNNKNVASSPAIIAAYREIEQDHKILNEVKRNDNTTWYPFGLVPYKNMERIMPSRRLNLTNGEITPIDCRVDNSTIEAAEITTRKIFDRVTSNITSISKSVKLSAHLTAGYDSRMVLSSCLRSGSLISYETISMKNSGSKIDCEIAKKITNCLKLEHEVITFTQPEEIEIDEWLDRTGHCIRDAVTILCKTVKSNDDDHFILTGSCGEVGRAFYWQKADLKENDITPEEIILRLGFEQSAFLVDRCKKWLAELNVNLSRTAILDLSYIDNRLGCWAGPAVYGHDITKPTISPFNEGEIYNLMISLPKKYKFIQQFAIDYINISEKSLTKLPFNRAVGVRKLFYLKHEIKKIIPSKIITLLKNNISFKRDSNA